MPCGPASLLLVLGLGRVLDGTSEDGPAVAAWVVQAQAQTGENETGEVRTIEGDPVFESWRDAVTDAAPVQELPRRKWIRHRVRPRERVSQIAARYGVHRHDLVEWNELDPGEDYPPKRRRSLKVLTRRVPPPRMRIRYIPKQGEGWGDVAAKFRVEGRDLRSWNWRTRRPKPGESLIVWVDPGLPLTVHPDPGTPVPIPDLEIPETGKSIGRPQRGRLQDGVQLPESDLYTRGFNRVLYGSSHTVRTVALALATFRHRTGYGGEVVIGAMSRPKGRRLRPHLSHQSGRDIDIRLPLLPGVPGGANPNPNPDEIDWYATWGLIEAFIDTGEVGLIFLDVSIQRRLYEAARAMGRSPEDLRGIIQWPFPEGAGRALVRHFDGHDGHIHVRIQCGPDEPRCRPRRRSPELPSEARGESMDEPEEAPPAGGGELINSTP